MQSVLVCLIGLLVFIQAAASQPPMIQGQVRLDDGLPVAGAQVALFDLRDLRRGALAHASTDAAGQFALPLAALGRAVALPQGFALGANYPNPFNPSTVIPYQLTTTAQVRLEVFNALGQRMATLVEGVQRAGAYQARWNATDETGQAVAAGVYLYRLTVDGASQTGRMVLIDGQAGAPMSGTGVAALPLADAEGAAYGLVVAGPGLVSHVDADFRVAAGMAPVEVAVSARPNARMKLAQSGILGDVDNNGRVDMADALLIAMYSTNVATTMPNNGDIRLGDVNGDGKVDAADAMLIATYSINPSAPALPSGIGQPWPAEPPIVEPPPAGLLTIPPITLTVGSSYEHTVVSEQRLYNVSYSARSNSDAVEVTPFPDFDYTVASNDVPIKGGRVVITGKALGTAEVTIESPFADAQTVAVTVVERPPSIDSVPWGESKTEDITMVFYIVEGVLDPIEEKIPWFLLEWRLGLGAADLLLEYLGFGSTEIETRNTQITWVEYEHSQTTAYAVSKQPVSVYHSTSGLLTEAFVTLQEAKKNVFQDIVLSFAPGWLMWPATAWSVVGDIQMYASILDVILAVERDESTKAVLVGLLAQDGSIIPGNSYLPFLMMKNDAENETAVFDLRLRVAQDIDIASEEVAIRPRETIDFGPFDVSPKTGYQILSNYTLTFTEQAGRDLKRVELKLDTDGYNQNKEYRVRARGPALTIEAIQASASGQEGPLLLLRRNEQFTLKAKVLNRSELYASSASAPLRYYCSSDPVMDPSGDDFLLAVEVEPLAGLGETQNTVGFPAPRLRTDRTGTEAPNTCWVSDLSQPIYYGACLWDEVEEEFNCSWVPVEVSGL